MTNRKHVTVTDKHCMLCKKWKDKSKILAITCICLKSSVTYYSRPSSLGWVSSQGAHTNY